MKAFILAAGLGTRLGSLTENKPKALVKVQGTEMLALTIQRLKSQGFTELIVNVHHYGQMVIDFLKKNDNFGVHIHISDERGQLLDTGGALLKARDYLMGEEPVLIHNVDVISEIDFKELLVRHTNDNALATLCVRNRNSDRTLIFDKHMELKGWTNKKSKEFKWASQPLTDYTAYAFSGIYVISPGFIHKIKLTGKFSIIDAWLSMAGQHKIKGYIDQSKHWFDLGTPDKIRQAELYLKNQPM
ncbi:MAG: nucleotidyltransferase family protein [Bacteroidetes bacterium]|nr:MAG: nucleotidyltransferase family protein [Bacteroidota bacterium]